LLEPTSGRAEVLGFDTRTQAVQIREKCGALLEYAGLYERLTANDNLEFYGRIWHMPAPELSARIKELLTHFDLWERRYETVSTWSHGMKQKLALARTLLHRPSLIFLDEPTSGLDPVAAAAFRADLASLVSRQGMTVFLTTHNLAEAEKLCDQVAIIRAGKLLTVGSPDQLGATETKVVVTGSGFNKTLLSALRNRPEISSVQLQNGSLILGLKEQTPVAPLVDLMVASGVHVEEVRRQETSLEEAFLTLVEEKTS
jgi:ABC-2 type transport system ATP-binding protein